MTTNIKYLKQKEKYLFHAFKSCGVLTQEHVDQYISKNRLKSFIKTGYIKVASHFFSTGNGTKYIYFLTSKGKKFAVKHCVSGEFYRSSSASHDIAVANQYMALPLEQQLTWITEKELLNVRIRTFKGSEKEDFFEEVDEIQNLNQWKTISPTDGGYIRDGQLHLLEVVTSNYSFEEVLAKCLFAEALNCPIEIIKI